MIEKCLVNATVEDDNFRCLSLPRSSKDGLCSSGKRAFQNTNLGIDFCGTIKRLTFGQILESAKAPRHGDFS